MDNIIKTDFKTFTDERGDIKKIAEGVDVLKITSNNGSRRASHYHKNTSHLCYLSKGSMDYYERPTGSTGKPIKLSIKSGQYFFTGPMIDHLMVFNEYSEFDCYSFGARDKESYENDLVRLDYDLKEEYNKN